MSANDDLIAWNTRWRLQNGVVSCKTCDASQEESDKESLFDHRAGCGYAGQGSRPWDDLDCITAAFRVPKG